MSEYTEKIHAKRLLGMLNKKKPCLHCPAAEKYSAEGPWINFTLNYKLLARDKYCAVCQTFIGYKNTPKCPCHKGKERAIKRTWEALEEKGYI